MYQDLPSVLDGGDAPISIEVEILVGDVAVLIPDQAVVGDHFRVEIHLNFGIRGDDLQNGGQVLDEEFLGLINIVTYA